jgi:hypothetical protein
MGVYGGPNITNDSSLVLLIDAANVKSMKSGDSTGLDLAGRQTLNGINLSSLSITNYTPSDSGNPSTAAVDFANDGSNFPYMTDSGQFDFRNEISWVCVACKETNSDRQSIWSAIEDVSPWDGAGLVSYSRDNNGKLAWWSGSSYGSWWDTNITLPTNKWIWAAGRWSSNTQKVWAKWDGVSIQTDSRTNSYFQNPTDQTNNFTLGDNGTDGDDGTGPNSRIIDGAIAYVAIWSKALSDDEVLQNYNAIKSRFGL